MNRESKRRTTAVEKDNKNFSAYRMIRASTGGYPIYVN